MYPADTLHLPLLLQEAPPLSFPVVGSLSLRLRLILCAFNEIRLPCFKRLNPLLESFQIVLVLLEIILERRHRIEAIVAYGAVLGNNLKAAIIPTLALHRYPRPMLARILSRAADCRRSTRSCRAHRQPHRPIQAVHPRNTCRQPATVMRGPYAGDQLSVDHIIPRAVTPELDNVIANLELMPLRLNERKNSHMRQRQRGRAQRLFHAGLLSREGRDVVVR